MVEDYPDFDEPDWILDESAHAPPPLDEMVANVWLNLISNRYVDGFDVEVSAFFGEEAVELCDRDFSLSVDIALTKAVIDVSFIHCRATPLSDPNEEAASGYEFMTTKSHSAMTSGGKSRTDGVEGRVALGPAGVMPVVEPKMGVERKKVTASERQVSDVETVTVPVAWSRIGPTKFRVGVSGEKLQGHLMAGVRAWRAFPIVDRNYSAVIATLTTRPSWIEFGELDADTLAGRIGLKVRNYLRTKNQRERQLFELLLKTLAAKGLSTGQNSTAMLAANIQVLRHVSSEDILYEARPYVLPTAQARHVINVDAQAIDTFLDLPASQRVNYLLQNGVSRGELDASLEEVSPQEPQRLFNAGSAPPSAQEALKFVAQASEPVPVKVWEKKIRNRARPDLTALGLIEVREGIVCLTFDKQVGVENALRHAAAKTPTLMAVREILLENPKATAVEIGEEIAVRFGRDYNTKSSKLRVGGALRRWAVWLDPYLVDPEGGSIAQRLAISASSSRPGVGAPSLATPDAINKVQKVLDSGLRGTSAAKAAGISRSTLYYWEKQGYVTIPNKRVHKKNKPTNK